MPKFQEFQKNQPARIAHQAILTSVKAMDQARQHAVLWFADIQRRKLYRELGYPTMTLYARQGLGFSRSRASAFSRLAARLDQLPQLKGALEKGEIGYTKANQVAAVSTRENEGAWLAEARASTRRQLEEKIQQAREAAAARRRGQDELPLAGRKGQEPPAGEKGQDESAPVYPPLPAAVVPVRLTVEFTPEQFARYEALLEKARKGKTGLPRDRAQMLLALLAGHLAQKEDPENRTSTSTSSRRRDAAPPFQVHLHRCPDCDRTTVQTGRGELRVSPATAERATCDARLSRPGERNTATIPPRIRRQVLARDRHRCRRPGCTSAHYLEVHHLDPRQSGGGNQPANLITLCAACHQLLHEQKWNLVRERPPRFGRDFP